MRALKRKVVAVFLIMLVVSMTASVLAIDGVQENVVMHSPTGYVPPEVNTYFIVDNEPAVLEVCSYIEGDCSGMPNCGKRQNYVDVFRLEGIDATSTNYGENELLGMVTNDPSILVPAGYIDKEAPDNTAYGNMCFNVTFYEPGYYTIRIGAFGSPERGGASEFYASGFVRVMDKQTRFCIDDGKVGQGSQFSCNEDGTYNKCNADGTQYEPAELCLEACGALSGCDDLKPNPDCTSSCISEDGNYKIESDGEGGTIRVEIPLEDGSTAVVNIFEGQIMDTAIDGVPVNSQNYQQLIPQIQDYNLQTVDTTIPKNVEEQSPGVDIVESNFTIESFEVGSDGENAFTPFQNITFKAEIAGLPNKMVGVTISLIDENYDRHQLSFREFELDSSGNATYEEAFYALLPDGLYKPMIELFEGQEKRDFRYWIGDRPDEGIIMVALDIPAFSQEVSAEMAAAEADQRLIELFNKFLVARDQAKAEGSWPDSAIDEFKAFMDYYIETRCVGNAQDNCEEAKANLLSDEKTIELMNQFEDEVLIPLEEEPGEETPSEEEQIIELKRDAYSEVLTAVSEDSSTISGYYDDSINTLKTGLQNVGGLALSLFSFDVFNLVKSIINLAGGSKNTREKLEFKRDQMISISGALDAARSVNDAHMLYDGFYYMMISPDVSTKEIREVLGANDEYSDTEIETLRRPFNDYVLTRDLVGAINQTGSGDVERFMPSIQYGVGWMSFYSAYKGYNLGLGGDYRLASYSDYPLDLDGGRTVTKNTYNDVGKAQHDRVVTAAFWNGMGNAFVSDSERLEITNNLYYNSADYFETVTTEYPDSGESPLADERLDEIQSIKDGQNLEKGFEIAITVVIAFASMGGISSLVSKAATATIGKLGVKLSTALASGVVNAVRAAMLIKIYLTGKALLTDCIVHYTPALGGTSYSETSRTERISNGLWERCINPGISLLGTTASLYKLNTAWEASKLNPSNILKSGDVDGKFLNFLAKTDKAIGGVSKIPTLQFFGTNWLTSKASANPSAASTSKPDTPTTTNGETTTNTQQGAVKADKINQNPDGWELYD